MNKDFIPYEEALALKELGFNEPCFAWYNDNGNYMLGIDEVRFDTKNTYHFNNTDSVSAPTFSQAFRWFREKHNLMPLVDRSYMNLYEFRVVEKAWGYTASTYEEAELACLKKLIELIKNK